MMMMMGGRHPRRRTLFLLAGEISALGTTGAFRLVFDEKNKYKEEVALKNGLPPLLGGFNEERDADDAYYSYESEYLEP